jgi:chromosome segregation ATPase
MSLEAALKDAQVTAESLRNKEAKTARRLQETNMQVATLVMEKESLRNKEANTFQRLEHVTAQFAILTLERDGAFVMINRLEKKLQADTISLEARIKKAEADFESLRANKAQVAQRLEQATMQVETEKDILCVRLSELQAKYDSIQSKSNEAEQEHKEEISLLKATMLRKDDKANALNEDIASLNSQIAALYDENTAIKSERDEHVNKSESTAQEISSMKEEVSNYSADVSNLGASIEALGRERDTAIEKLVEILELKIVDYRTLLSDLANVEAKSKDDIANLEESVRKKTDEACALNEIITSSSAQIAHVTVKCSALTEERDEAAMKLEEVTLEKDELAKRLASKEEEVSNYSADVSKLEASIEALSRERDTAIAKMNEILSHNGVAEEVLSCLKNEKDELASTLAQMKADVSHLEAQEENSNVNICKLNATIVDLQSRNAHLVKDIQTSKSELKLLSRSEKSSANYQAPELEMGDCLKQLRLATDEKVQKFTKMPDEKAKWKENVADLEGSSADKTLQIKEPDELQSTVKSLHINKVDILKSKLDDLKRSLNAKITDLQTDLVAAFGGEVSLIEQLKESFSEGRRFVDEASVGGGGAIGTWAHERHRATNHQPLLRDNVLPLSLSGVHGVTNAQPCRRNEDGDGIAIDDRRDDCPRSSAQSNNVAEVTSNAKGKSVVDVVYVVNGVEFPASEQKNKVKPSLSSVVAGAIVVEASEDGKTIMRQRGRKRNNSEVGIVSKRRKRTNVQEYRAGYKFKKFFAAPYNRVRRLL